MSDPVGKARARALIAIALTVAVALVVVVVVMEDARQALDPEIVAGAAAPSATASLGSHRPASPAVNSNIYRSDYVGPNACQKCHAYNYDLWRGHPHSKMTQFANATSVVAPFAGETLTYGGGEVVFDQSGGGYRMTLSKNGAVVRTYEITKTIGSRFVQMYAGIQLFGPEPEDDEVYRLEGKLPFSYWIGRDLWFPQMYDEAPATPEYDERGALTRDYDVFDKRLAGTWTKSCVLCHTTFPYAQRFDAVGQDRVAGFPLSDIDFKPAGGRDPKTHDRVEPWDVVAFGISCESCHFGGRAHAKNQERISFVPRGEGFSLGHDTPQEPRKSPYVINSICRQCHNAKTQGPMYPNGAASWNSGEAADLAAGACTSAIRCTDCHNPHRAGPTEHAAPDDPAHVAACGRCHQEIADSGTAHTHHAETVSCLDCHMPRVVTGLAGVTRSHRISSPTDRRMLEGGWPNACNLCHLDRSTQWTIDALAKSWKARVALDPPPLDQPAGKQWLAAREPVVRKVAAAAYARSPLGKDAWPEIVKLLNDESPPNRMFGLLAVERLLGRRITYTPWAPSAEREQQLRALTPP